MTSALANLFAPAPTITPSQGMAGGVVAAPQAGAEGAFAEALVAFRAAATSETAAASAAPPAGTAPHPTKIPVSDARYLLALKDKLPELLAQGKVYKAGPDGELVPLTEEEANALLKSVGLPPLAAKTGTEAGAGTDAVPGENAPEDKTPALVIDAADLTAMSSNVTAGLVQPQQTTTSTPAAAETDNVEIALQIADAVQSRPPAPGTDAPKKDGTAPVKEGRAAAPTAAPVIEIADARPAARQLFESVAPKAVANAVTPDPATATAPAPQTPPVAAANTAPAPTPSGGAPVPPQAVAQTVPPAAQEIAATPHVVSMQATTAAAAGPDSQPQPGTSAPAAFANAAPQAQATAPAFAPASATDTPDAAPAQATPVSAQTNTPAPETPQQPVVIEAAPPQTATVKPQPTVSAAPDKDKPAEKSAAPAPAPQPAATETEQPQPAETKVAADTQVKTKEADSDASAPEKPVKAEKPLAANDPKAPQPPASIADKPILPDSAVKTVQQQMQNLPAAAIPQIAGEIATKFKQGATRFEIRLDPPELGRVDVRIEVDADGKVHSRLTVEKSETLDLLKADQRVLERALHEAGFKSEQNSLSFALKDERGGGQQQKFEEQRFLREQAAAQTKTEDEQPVRLAAGIAYRAMTRGAGGLDLRV